MKKLLCFLLAFSMLLSAMTGFFAVSAEDTAAAADDAGNTTEVNNEPLLDGAGNTLTVAKIDGKTDRYYAITGNIFKDLSYTDDDADEEWRYVTLIVYNDTAKTIAFSIVNGWNEYLYETNDGKTKYGTDTIGAYANYNNGIPSYTAKIITFNIPKSAFVQNGTAVSYTGYNFRIQKLEDSSTVSNFTEGEGVYIMSPSDNSIAKNIVDLTVFSNTCTTSSAAASDIPNEMRELYAGYQKGVSLKASGSQTYMITNYDGTDCSPSGAFRYVSFAAGKATKSLQFLVRNNSANPIDEFCISYRWAQSLYPTDTEYYEETKTNEGVTYTKGKVSSGTKYSSATGTDIASGETAVITLTLPRICDALNSGNITNGASKENAFYKYLGFRINFTSKGSVAANETVDVICLNDYNVNYGLQSAYAKDNITTSSLIAYDDIGTKAISYKFSDVVNGDNYDLCYNPFKYLTFANGENSVNLSVAAYFNQTSGAATITRARLARCTFENWSYNLYAYDGTSPAITLEKANAALRKSAQEKYLTVNSLTGVSVGETDTVTIPDEITNNAVNMATTSSGEGKILSKTVTTLTFNIPRYCYAADKSKGETHYVYYDADTSQWKDDTTAPSDTPYTTYWSFAEFKAVNYTDLDILIGFSSSSNSAKNAGTFTLSCIECSGTVNDANAVELVNRGFATERSGRFIYLLDNTALAKKTSNRFAQYVNNKIYYENFENSTEDKTVDNLLFVLGSGSESIVTNSDTSTVKAYSGNSCLKFEAGAQHYCQVGLYIAPFVLRKTGQYTLSYKIYIEKLPNGNCTSCSKYVEAADGDYVQYNINNTAKYIQWAGKLFTKNGDEYTAIDTYSADAYVKVDDTYYECDGTRYTYKKKDCADDAGLTVQVRYCSGNNEYTGALKNGDKAVGTYIQDYTALENFKGEWQTVSITFDVTDAYVTSNGNGAYLRLGLADYLGTRSVYYIDDLTIARTSDLAEASVNVSNVAGAGIDVTADLSLPCYALVPVWAKLEELSAEVTRNGKTTTITSDNGDFSFVTETVEGITVGDNQKLCKFTYGGIGSQCMGDEVKIVIKYNGNEIASYGDSKGKGYSVTQYCQNQYEKYEARVKAGTTQTGDAELVTLLADMLEFGSLAQKVVQYKANNLPNSLDWVSGKISTFDATKVSYVSNIITYGNTTEGCKFTSAGIDIHSTIKIRVKTTVDTNKYSVRYKKNGGEWQEATVADDGYIRTGAIAATEFGTEYIFQIYKTGTDGTGDNLMSELHYSVNTYIYRMNSKNAFENATDKLNLIKAMYNFGQSAKEYNKAVQAADNNEAT